MISLSCLFFFSSRRRHTRFDCDWSSDVCSSDLVAVRHGFKRCRWRELWRAEIHELLVATVQNVAVLARNRVRKPCATAAARLSPAIANSFAPKLALLATHLTRFVRWPVAVSVS